MSILFLVFNVIIYSTWSITPSLAAAPVINNLPNTTSIVEDTSTEVLLYTLDVTDADGDSITCVFGSNPGNDFTLRLDNGPPTTWAIYTVAGANTYDYTSTPSYSLDVDCTANGDTVSGTYTVYITQNQAPAIQNLPDSVNVSTATKTIGDTIFTVTSTDVESDQITYSMTCAPASPACPFQILDSGSIQVDSDISSFTITGYDITVTASDPNGGNGVAKILTVLFTDINSQPQIENLGSTFNVLENSVLGDNVVTASCTDDDVTDTLVYTMTCSPASGSTYFVLNSVSGDIDTSSSSNINYEYLVTAGSTSFACTVTCFDGRADDTATVTFAVTDVNEAPSFSQNAYSITADEGQAGTVIQTTAYSIIEEDSGDTKTFSLDCGTSTGYFAINTGTGMLSYSSDYDVDDGVRPTSVSCSVTVTDSGGLSDTASLSIAISNINDNTPTFSNSFYIWYISEVDPVGTTVGTAAATDGDIGTYGDIIYSLEQTALSDEFFQVDQSGVVKIKKSISSLGAGVTPNFYVLATDGGGNETRVTVTVIIAATTTPAAAATTDRYKKFFDDGRNIAWFTACCVILVVTAILIGWMCFSFSGSQSAYKFQCCRMWDEPIREHRNWGEVHRYDYEPRRPPKEAPRPRRDPADFNFWSESYRAMD